MPAYTLERTHVYIEREQIQVTVKIYAIVHGILLNCWCVYYENKYFNSDVSSEDMQNSKDIR